MDSPYMTQKYYHINDELEVKVSLYQTQKPMLHVRFNMGEKEALLQRAERDRLLAVLSNYSDAQ